jgi:protein HIRA/HIR1
VWRCAKLLRRHEGDVLDVAWSADGLRLATCSIDNTICIWVVATGEAEAVLRGHNGPVKGVVWDPVGRFLASQGDDKKVLIWAADTWKLKSSIKEPFSKIGIMSSLFLRLAWSVDGSTVVMTHCVNSGLPVATCVDREGFSKAQHFVGHTKPITAARANPMLFHPATPDGDDASYAAHPTQLPSCPVAPSGPSTLSHDPARAVTPTASTVCNCGCRLSCYRG